MTLSRRRSVIATVGLIATSWLFAACSTASPPETQPLGTAGVEPSAIAVETSNQSVIVTNNAGKPIEDVLITIQPVSVAPPFTLTRAADGERGEARHRARPVPQQRWDNLQPSLVQGAAGHCHRHRHSREQARDHETLEALSDASFSLDRLISCPELPGS